MTSDQQQQSSADEPRGDVEDVPVPYVGFATVKPEWQDANGHMNMGHYTSAFDLGSCSMFDDIGLGWGYTESGEGSIFTASASIDYRRELLADAPLEMTTLLIAYDRRRIHIYQEMFHREARYLAAQAEFMFVHVSLESRRMTPVPDFASQRLAQIMTVHSQTPRPAFLGRAVGLDWRPV